jgi:adenylate cyclase
VSQALGAALILAVDDEPANLALLRKLLFRLGYRVVEAIDGPSALVAVAEHNPDVVLLDVLMPGLNGFEVCRQLRAIPEHASLPILLLTSLTTSEDKAVGLEAGANDFLAKPFEEIELIARLRSLLRTKALQDRLADLLGRYVSNTVAERILHDPAAALRLGGDRRRVTSMFADIRGYTSLTETHPPEAALAVLNRYLRMATDSVLMSEGTVSAFQGDAVFGIFGAPIGHADDPRRAVEAALGLQAGVAAMENPELPGIRLQAGIGLTTGEVIAGNVGSERRMHYTVVGDCVNVASRLQVLAGPGQILADEETYQAVRDSVVAQDLGSLRLSGKGEWVRAFNIFGRAPLPTGAQA